MGETEGASAPCLGCLDSLDEESVAELLELRAGKVETLLTEVTEVLHRTESLKSGLLVLSVVDEGSEGIHGHIRTVTGTKVAGNLDHNLVVILHRLLFGEDGGKEACGVRMIDDINRSLSIERGDYIVGCVTGDYRTTVAVLTVDTAVTLSRVDELTSQTSLFSRRDDDEAHWVT